MYYLVLKSERLACFALEDVVLALVHVEDGAEARCAQPVTFGVHAMTDYWCDELIEETREILLYVFSSSLYQYLHGVLGFWGFGVLGNRHRNHVVGARNHVGGS